MSDKNQTNIIEAFNFTSRYLLIDDLLDNPYCEQMVGQIYPSELQLNKASFSGTETKKFVLNLSISNDFNFEIVKFSFLDGDVPSSSSYGVYISLLIRLIRVCSYVDDFNNRNLF